MATESFYLSLFQEKMPLAYLEQHSTPLISECCRIVLEFPFEKEAGTALSDIKCLFFEYFDEYETICYPVTSKGFPTGSSYNLTLLPSEDILFADFLSQVEDIKRQQPDTIHETIDDAAYQFRHEAFRRWFSDCWIRAKRDTKTTLYAFLALHDTMYTTNLDEYVPVREDELATWLHSRP